MVRWSVLAGLGLIVAAGGCASRTGQVAYTTPGWYLERPRFMLVTGPEVFAGPFTYEQCEAERVKFPDETAKSLLCIQEKTRPGPYGPFDKIQADKKPSQSS
ncbi:MAG: hypothetical protein J0J01_14435 [Reyranella sp.]|uniref:hypothetical protein n=1 Tax=Reyranella sp. TaxID=1929291 RepID=UPI001AC32893|nr:hypothetical protein [Reyranella sp.]MBN9088104.1 hypothetical protein [Reyranella sp.]